MGELDMHTDIGLDRAVSIKQSFKKLHIAFVVCIALSVPALYGQTVGTSLLRHPREERRQLNPDRTTAACTRLSTAPLLNRFDRFCNLSVSHCPR
jgi:hypothetical protein